MLLIDEWHDYLRLVVICLSITNLVYLGIRWAKYHDEYNPKDRDLWFVLVMWCITSVVLPLEGILEDRNMEPRVVFYTAAVIITFRALLRGGYVGTVQRAR